MNLPSILTTVLLLTSSAAGLVFADEMGIPIPFGPTTAEHGDDDDCSADGGDGHDHDDEDNSTANGTESGSSSSGSSSSGNTTSSSSSSSSDDNSTSSNTTSSGSSSSGSSSGSSSSGNTTSDDAEESDESEETGDDEDAGEADDSEGTSDEEETDPCAEDVDGNETKEDGNETVEPEVEEAEPEAAEELPAPDCAEVHISDSGDDLLGEDSDWSWMVAPTARHLSVKFEGSYGLPGLGGGPDVTLVDGSGRIVATGDSADGWGGMSVDLFGPMTPGLWRLSYSGEGVLSSYWVSIDLQC